MSTIGNYSPSLLNSARNGYATAASQPARMPSLAQALNEEDSNSSDQSPPTTITFSAEAKSYLASLADTAATADKTTSDTSAAADGAPDSAAPTDVDAAADTTDDTAADTSLDKVASDARAWLDDKYKTLGIPSAMLDGKVAVDFSDQSRATLSAISSNAGKLFTDDESMAASNELGMRFGSALSPHVVIARHTGDYASLYQAASDYLDKAGPDEKATDAWKDQKQAVTDGLAMAEANFGKAPDTGNPSDPVQALLITPSTAGGSLGADATTAQVAANARTMLDDQKNTAKDKGLELVFDKGRNGQQVDFSKFDNRTLATMVLNQDSAFSPDETRSAKNELDQRTRTTMYNSLFPSSNSGSSPTGALGLMQTYTNMSDEEKAVLGVTADTTNRIMQNYKTQQSVQSTLASYL